MFEKLRCRVFGHPTPGNFGHMLPPIPFLQKAIDLPFLDAYCPRCKGALRLHFDPMQRGSTSAAHYAAILRWKPIVMSTNSEAIEDYFEKEVRHCGDLMEI